MQKIFKILLQIIIVINLFSIPSYATEAPVVSLSSAEAAPGETVEIYLNLANCGGFNSLNVEVGYNSNVMALTEAKNNTKVGGTYTPAPAIETNPYNFKWNKATNINFNGLLATLTFEISAEAEEGIYPLTVDFYKGPSGNWIDGKNCNFDENKVPLGLTYQGGSITVKKPNPLTISDLNTDSGISFKANISDENIKGKVIAALYNGDKVEKVVMETAAESVDIDFTQTSGYIKVMWWDMTTMGPLAEFAEINIQ